MSKFYLMSIIVYVFFFYKLGNTILRYDSTGNKSIQLRSLFTEGIIGPIRTFFLLIFYGNFFGALNFIKFEFFRLSNPFSAFFFCYYIYKIIKFNFFK